MLKLTVGGISQGFYAHKLFQHVVCCSFTGMTGTLQTERWTPENSDRNQGVFLNMSLGSRPFCSMKDP